MAQYKAILIDFDGCIVKVDQQISSRVEQALLAAKEKIHVSIATGRSTTGRVGTLIKQLNLPGPHIVYGGAAIFDGLNSKFLWQAVIPRAVVNGILKILDDNNLNFIVYEGDDKYLAIKDPKIHYDPSDNYKQLKDLPNKAVRRFNIRFDTDEQKAIHYQKLFLQKYPKMKVMCWGQYNACGLDITAASKLEALTEYLRIVNLKADDIIAIGDGYNDYPLLMAAGFKVAMGNAVPDLKAIADYIAPSVDQDGVADAIEKFVLK